MNPSQREQRRRDRHRILYNEIKGVDPALYEKAVRIGSLVTCAPVTASRLAIAASVECAVMSLILELKG